MVHNIYIYIYIEGIFYTDANGLAMQERMFVPKEDQTVNMPSNLYPVNTAILVRSDDDKQQLMYIFENIYIERVMPDRPEGASYISNRIEMVVHRVVKTNDNRGICEHLIEETSNIYIYIYNIIYI